MGEDENNNTGSTDENAFAPIETQEEFNKAVSKRLERERSKFGDYADLKAKADQFDELEQSKKTELERLSEDRDSQRSRADSAETQAARLQVALDKGLTATQAKRLVGTTAEELAADADQLIADLAPTKPAPPTRTTRSLRSGSTSSGDSALDSKERAAQALRGIRNH